MKKFSPTHILHSEPLIIETGDEKYKQTKIWIWNKLDLSHLFFSHTESEMNIVIGFLQKDRISLAIDNLLFLEYNGRRFSPPPKNHYHKSMTAIMFSHWFIQSLPLPNQVNQKNKREWNKGNFSFLKLFFLIWFKSLFLKSKNKKKSENKNGLDKDT